MTTITPRIGAAASASTTKRVATVGATLAADPWDSAWGESWGNSWIPVATSASPAEDVTPRISAAITANTTKRVTLA